MKILEKIKLEYTNFFKDDYVYIEREYEGKLLTIQVRGQSINDEDYFESSNFFVNDKTLIIRYMRLPVSWQNKGFASHFLKSLTENNEYNIIVECVLNPHLAKLLQSLGFCESHNEFDIATDMVYKIK